MSKEYEEYRELLRQGKCREAARFAASEYLRDSGGNPFWLVQESKALLRAGNNKEAFETAKRALSVNRMDPYAVAAAADSLLALGRFEEALHYYQETVGHARLKLRSRRGVLECLSSIKKWNEVLSYTALWEEPTWDIVQWKVKSLAGLGKNSEAIRTCHEYLKSDPDNKNALWELVELEVARDGVEEVLKRTKRLAKIPSNPPVYGEIYASLCRRAGKPDLAVEQYSRMAKKDTGHRILSKHAFTLARSGREAEAVEILEELLRLEPGNKYLHASYSAACGRLGKLDRAVNFYQELLTKYPEEHSLYGRIRKLHSKMGA